MRKSAIAERTERRISAATSIALCAGIVLLQILLTLLLCRFLREYVAFIYGALELMGIVVAVRIYTRNESPAYKLSWMCLLLAVPVAGTVLFILWGGTHQAKTLSLKKIPAPPISDSARQKSAANIARLRRADPCWGRLASYLQKRDFLLYDHTDAAYFSDGAAFFDDLIDHMRQARTYIFLEYYILAEGEIWDRCFSVLKERAAQGVEIRIIFDDFGNITRLSDQMLQSIQEAGIEIEIFNPVHRYVNRIYFNYRDHRKIAVIDGYYAYTGGVNIADEYANLISRFGHWKDSAVRVEGEAAWAFAQQFIQMWKMMGCQMPNEDDYYRPRQELQGHGAGMCQPFTDGPQNNPDNPVEDVYLQLISSARKMLYITTPYYAVEEYVQKALCIAADAGVDVRLMLPAVPDHKLAYLVAETYWGQLLAHGVKIYRYTPGFLHGKSVLVDREVALIGSTNMDYRTFQLQYECGVLLYHSPVIEDLLEDMDHVMGESQRYTLREWGRRPWYRRGVACILKLFAIWL